MRLLLVSACLLTGSLASMLHRQTCKTPPFFAGLLTVSTESDWERVYYYNPAEERLGIFKIRNFTEVTVTYEYLLHFREGVMYDIGGKALRCVKRPLKTDYRPIGVPDDASLVGSVIMAGTVFSTWEGLTPGAEHYQMLVIGERCVPLMTTFNTIEYGDVRIIFEEFEVDMAPLSLSRPWFCPDIEAAPEGSPVDFLTLIFKSDTWHFIKFK